MARIIVYVRKEAVGVDEKTIRCRDSGGQLPGLGVSGRGMCPFVARENHVTKGLYGIG